LSSSFNHAKGEKGSLYGTDDRQFAEKPYNRNPDLDPRCSRSSLAECKERHYGASAAATRYFTLHQTADVHHARVWREALWAELARDSNRADEAFGATEHAATALWTALDGIERQRQLRNA